MLTIANLPALGQLPEFNERFELGVVGGVSITNVRSPNTFLFPDRWDEGFHFGGTFQFNSRKVFSIGSELFYRRVVNPSNYFEFSTLKGTARMDYLGVAVPFRASFGNKGIFFMSAGPYMNFLLQHTFTSNTSVNINGVTAGDGYQVSLTEEFNRAEIGLVTGLGLTYPIQNRYQIGFQTSYQFGIFDPKIGAVNPGPEVKTRSINFLIISSYRFGYRAE